MPPIFRIMGGHGRSRGTHNNNSNNSSHNNNNNNNNNGGNPNDPASSGSNSAQSQPTSSSATSQTAPQPQQTGSTAAPSRYTYPGMRASQPPAVTGRLPNNNNLTASAPPTSQSRSSNSGGSAPNSANGTTNLAASAPPSSSASSNTTTTTTTTTANVGRPGAFQVTRTTVGPAIVYRVTIPPGISPGAEFHVHAGQRRVRVRCPPTSRPGQSLQITLPPEPVENQRQLKAAPLTSATESSSSVGNPTTLAAGTGGAVPMTPEVARVNAQAEETGGAARSYLVDIPPNVTPGMSFTVNVGGQRFMVTCPDSAGPNMKIRIVPPTVREEPEAAPKTQVFEVSVPAGVQPGQPFALVANGQRVLVTCPPNVVPGQKIRFQLPVSQVVSKIQLAYESNVGWRRTIRVSDMKFQWVRLDQGDNQNNSKNDSSSTTSTSTSTTTMNNGTAIDVESMERFDFKKSAYVRKITYLEGNDARMRTGRVQLIPANEAVVESRLVVQNRTLLSYADIAEQQEKALDDKQQWFQNICSQLTSAWEDGRIKIVVRRRYLLHDSVDAVMALSREDMRKRWRMEFLGEPGIDAGGVSREWFELVTEQIFDPAFGLFVSSTNNQMSVEINPAASFSCPDDYLVYFRFLGRVIGRALFDRQLIKGHMVRTLYKHLLGWPITFEDIKNQDEEYYQSLKKLTNMDDISMMCLDFTVTEDSLGARREVELMEGGAMREVTTENLAEYLEANLRYRLLDRVKPQLTELLLGFYDVVPEPALTIFDANELELILCGLPTIDMDDWRANTKYSGLFEGRGPSEQAVKWFWEIVSEEFDQEMKARLLQFVTGSSGVPARGFSVLQGIDGNIKKFCVHGVDRDVYVYPRAHTCFNRIDLPNYSSKGEMHKKLRQAVTMSGVGFGIE